MTPEKVTIKRKSNPKMNGWLWVTWIMALGFIGYRLTEKMSPTIIHASEDGSTSLTAYEPTSNYGSVPFFRLIDQHGETFTQEELLGTVWVVDFVFTTCAGPCPLMTAQFADLQDRYSQSKDFRLVSISVNPEFDTPEVLKVYGDQYGADHSRWAFLTGDREEIHKLAWEGFHVGTEDDPIFHSLRFILINRTGKIHGYYISTEPEELERLRNDVKMLLSESL